MFYDAGKQHVYPPPTDEVIDEGGVVLIGEVDNG
jgi:hypothetical protein